MEDKDREVDKEGSGGERVKEKGEERKRSKRDKEDRDSFNIQQRVNTKLYHIYTPTLTKDPVYAYQDIFSKTNNFVYIWAFCLHVYCCYVYT